MKNFRELLTEAKLGNDMAIIEILDLYKGLICKESFVDEKFDVDLNQLLYKTLLLCISKFKIE